MTTDDKGTRVLPARNAGQTWTKKEVEALPILNHYYGPIGYFSPKGLTDLFFGLTGRRRDHHAIYMAWTRYKHGVYDSLLGRD